MHYRGFVRLTLGIILFIIVIGCVKKVQSDKVVSDKVHKSSLIVNKLFYDEKKAVLIKPYKVINTSGGVLDFVYRDGLVYVATSFGTVEIYNLNSRKRLKNIKLAYINTFDGDKTAPKVFSVDLSPDKKKIVIISQDELGTELFIEDNGKLIKLISSKKRLTMTEARFISNNMVLIGLLSSHIILYDIDAKKVVYKKQIDSSSFSDMALNELKTKVAITNESGKIIIVDPNNGLVLKVLEGGNVDKIYQLDYRAKHILAGGQDRRLILYNEYDNKIRRYDSNFLVYTVGLSPSVGLLGFSVNEDSDIAIISLNSDKTYILKGHSANLNRIYFIDDKTILSGSDDNKVIIWRLKK